jgi:hypothetical protein
MSIATGQDSSAIQRAASSVHSQYGEDGIIEYALDLIGEGCDRWCVEFGAWDGKHLSNTCHLIQSRSYSAVMMECDATKFRDLQATYSANMNVFCANRWVGFDGENALDIILASTPIPKNFDVLSIDIDGNDYHVWEAVTKYQPKLVIIEFNPSIPTAVEFVQARDKSVSQGCSLLSLNKLANRKGYELIAATPVNAIFVDRQYFPRFDIADNSPAALRTDESHVTYLFQGFDGTLFVRGCNKLMWHGVDLNEEQLQHLPSWLRKHPAQLGRWGRRIINWYRWRRRAA